MNEQRLEMKYHPAKKEVRFKRFVSGKEIEIQGDSKLKQYMNDHGNFVLQYQGNEFFEAIAGAFDGEEVIQVDVITTRLDYEDFKQMVEYYNKSENSTIKITATLLAELPDMDATYREVKKHGEKSIGILEKHLEAIDDVPLNDKRVKECVDDFTENINTEKSSIREKIDKMTNDQINLCFAGVYSAGKSALINAILGYQILPESVKSETAKMFRIESPKPGKPVQIVFGIKDGAENHGVILSWDETSRCFIFGAGPNEENVTQRAIRGVIDENRGEEQHLQVYKILEALNSRDDIDADIDIYFPIPLDSERVQFVIYDTPGTDSNVVEHQRILQDALSEQTHSILVFVAAPTKMEGEGNHALLSYLKAAEKKDSKTSIDLGRSLFIINWADSIKASDRAHLQSEKIQLKGGDFAIDLSDKKLFFTSARLAYAARAKILGVQIDEEEEDFLEEKRNQFDKEFVQYFRQNRSAASEYATQKMLETSAAALEKAKEKGDTLSAVLICSGLYTLEEEIKTYGKKYASAIRAFAIIDSVDKALVKVKTTVAVLQNKNSKNLNEVNMEIETLSKELETSIEKVRDKHKRTNVKPKHTYTLNLDGDYFQDYIVKPVKEFIGGLLKDRWWVLPPESKKEDKDKILKKIESTLKKYTDEFHLKKQALLEKLRDAFIADVKSAIQRNGGITDEAKAFILAIDAPEIKPFSGHTEEFGAIYDDSERTETILWVFDITGIDKKKLMQEVDRKLTKIGETMADGFQDEFDAALNDVRDKTIKEFTDNKERYSRLMRAMLADKEAMVQLGEKIAEAASALEGCQKELETTIWSVKK
nr:dynamin family protein [uncultured Fretibacterium sp.]